jgi:hypothetical protein
VLCKGLVGLEDSAHPTNSTWQALKSRKFLEMTPPFPAFIHKATSNPRSHADAEAQEKPFVPGPAGLYRRPDRCFISHAHYGRASPKGFTENRGLIALDYRLFFQ